MGCCWCIGICIDEGICGWPGTPCIILRGSSHVVVRWLWLWNRESEKERKERGEEREEETQRVRKREKKCRGKRRFTNSAILNVNVMYTE